MRPPRTVCGVCVLTRCFNVSVSASQKEMWKGPVSACCDAVTSMHASDMARHVSTSCGLYAVSCRTSFICFSCARDGSELGRYSFSISEPASMAATQFSGAGSRYTRWMKLLCTLWSTLWMNL